MSTHYAPLKKVPARDLFDGRLEPFGVREHVVPDDTSERKKYLTDGRNYLLVNISEDGFVNTIKRGGRNAPSKILGTIADAFDTDIVSEYEPQYWGFDTREEWDACWEKLHMEDEEKEYVELMKYLQDPNNIPPGATLAEIAKALVEKDPSLLLPINKEKLLDEMHAIYDREHVAIITLTPEEVAAAEMSVTHEDDLPSA